jgi:hypothetical protein
MEGDIDIPVHPAALDEAREFLKPALMPRKYWLKWEFLVI